MLWPDTSMYAAGPPIAVGATVTNQIPRSASTPRLPAILRGFRCPLMSAFPRVVEVVQGKGGDAPVAPPPAGPPGRGATSAGGQRGHAAEARVHRDPDRVEVCDVDRRVE